MELKNLDTSLMSEKVFNGFVIGTEKDSAWHKCRVYRDKGSTLFKWLDIGYPAIQQRADDVFINHDGHLIENVR